MNKFMFKWCRNILFTLQSWFASYFRINVNYPLIWVNFFKNYGLVDLNKTKTILNMLSVTVQDNYMWMLFKGWPDHIYFLEFLI